MKTRLKFKNVLDSLESMLKKNGSISIKEKSYKQVGPSSCTYIGTEKPLGKRITTTINRLEEMF